MILKKIKNFIQNPKLLLFYMDLNGLIRIDDAEFLKIRYEKAFNKELDLNNPKTFNEKLQWLKLNDRKEIYTTLVDKYEAKKYVSDIIGNNYIIPTLGIYDKWDDIDFNELPSQFVIKCTHDSGGIVIVKDKNKLDKQEARKKINKCLKRNFFFISREWPYKNIKPRIIIEKFMGDKNNESINDYKFFVFNGKVKCFKIDFNRFVKHQANYYDENANLLKFGEQVCPPDFEKKLIIPDNLKEMIKLAEKLSDNNPFVRVDFYNIENKIYFGEITFYPASGFGKFIPDEWDKILGNWLNLNDISKVRE